MIWPFEIFKIKKLIKESVNSRSLRGHWKAIGRVSVRVASPVS